MNEVVSPHLALRPHSPGRGGLRIRLAAAGVHLLISVLVACCVLILSFFGWYPEPLAAISGVGPILILLLLTDAVLGPLLTFVVFDRAKRSLRFDLACIGILQLTALAYGIHIVEAGRPHYLVFVKDRFEVVSRVDLQADDLTAAKGNPAARPSPFGPRVVSAEIPESAQERQKMLFESAQGGRDVQHFPKQYRAYETHAARAAGRAQPLAALRELNPDRYELLERAVAQSGLPEASLKFLPIKGPKGDATMLIAASSGEIKAMAALTPWRD